MRKWLVAFFLAAASAAADSITLFPGGGGQGPPGPPGGAPTDAEYVVGGPDGTLTAERVCTDTDTVDCDMATAAQAKFNLVFPIYPGSAATTFEFKLDPGNDSAGPRTRFLADADDAFLQSWGADGVDTASVLVNGDLYGRVSITKDAVTNTFTVAPTSSESLKPYLAPDGTAGAPAYSFTSATTSGIRYSSGIYISTDQSTPYSQLSLASGSAKLDSFRTGPDETYIEATNAASTPILKGYGTSGTKKAEFQLDPVNLKLDVNIGDPTAVNVFRIGQYGAQFIDSGTRPACAVGVRGVQWLEAGGAGVSDSFEVCYKDAADAYAWRAPLLDPGSNGFVARTGAGAFSARTFGSSDGSIIWTNPAGTAGNPDAIVDNAVYERYSAGTATPTGNCFSGSQIYAETDRDHLWFCVDTDTWADIGPFDASALVDFTSGTATPSSACTAGKSVYAETDRNALWACTSNDTWTDLTVTTSAYATIDNEDTPLTQRTTLNFAGAGVNCADDINQTTCTIAGGGTSDAIPRPNTARHYLCYFNNQSSAWVCEGGPKGWDSGEGWGRVAPTASDGYMGLITTEATTPNDVRFGFNDTDMYLGRNVRYQAYIKLNQTTNQRIFFGFSDTYAPSSDDPAINVAAFRWSTSASDANWKCVTNDGAGGGTINDSGIAVGTASGRFEIVETSGTNFKFYINGSLVCTNSTNLPSGAVYAWYFIATLAAEAKATQIGHMYMETDK